MLFVGFLTLCLTSSAFAQAEGKALVEITPALLDNVKPSDDQVTAAVDGGALVVTVQPGKADYPGITITPAEGQSWDLSAFGHVEATISNPSDKPLNVSLRLDNAGDWSKGQPTNTESATIPAKGTGKVSVIFGYQYGKKPGFKLNPAKVTQVLIFTGKSKDERSYRIESIVATGPAGEKPPVNPASIRIKPENGVMLGGSVAIDTEKQVSVTSGSATVDQNQLAVAFVAGKDRPSVVYKPAVGRWDMRDGMRIRVLLKNTGTTPATPRVRVDSDRGPSQTVVAAEALKPGAETEIVIPFMNPNVWVGPTELKGATHLRGQADTDSRFGSDAIKSVIVSFDKADAPDAIRIQSVVGDLPPPTVLPEWVGKRPPVEGEWTQTFNEDFDGTEVDTTKWNFYGENYWDKQSHFSKDNVIVKDGVARLRFEKKRGFHNDDPNHKRGQTNYATGFLQTYGKWVQRYGYFEARMKLPTAPGLWPAFWMMPDRGVAAGEQWRRADTARGGMEFDIMEHLTRWGKYRYNVAFHWDGYDKNHKATGSEGLYIMPDKDGYITAGLLWLPGKAVYYANGVEVARWENERISNVQSEMMFTLPMGGWDNSPLDDALLPDDFVIDYVRAWQRKDLASEVDGPQPQPK
jgi:beta-glucanase (GH16 family)